MDCLIPNCNGINQRDHNLICILDENPVEEDILESKNSTEEKKDGDESSSLKYFFSFKILKLEITPKSAAKTSI